jgi:DNA-binding transcriptional MerR regulator
MLVHFFPTMIPGYESINKKSVDSMNPLPDVNIGNDEPLYNIGVVSRMTGISMATLRAWERRYDFPEADRTAGGHRLYSERALMRLKWVKDRIDEGMQTAQAINALRHQEETGHLVLTGQDLTGEPTRLVEGDITTEKPYLSVVHKRLVDALIDGNVSTADLVVGEAMAAFSPEDLILGVFGPAFFTIGDLWMNDQISVATEHLASNYLRQRLLMWMISGPPPRVTRSIVLACAPGELHEGSLLILGSLLRRRRWPVAYLGQTVPLEDLASFAEEIDPNLLVVVAMTENTASNLVDWPKRMPRIAQENNPIFGFGGRVFVEEPEWRARIDGMYLGSTLDEGIKTIERVLLTT